VIIHCFCAPPRPSSGSNPFPRKSPLGFRRFSFRIVSSERGMRAVPKVCFRPIGFVRLRCHPGLQELAVGGCVVQVILKSIEDIKAEVPPRCLMEVVIPRKFLGALFILWARYASSRLRTGPRRALSYCDQGKGGLKYVNSSFQRVLKVTYIECKASSSFCLDIETCSGLRSITSEATLTESSTISISN
jgi:hypothetical protein